eukprot:341965_1
MPIKLYSVFFVLVSLIHNLMAGGCTCTSDLITVSPLIGTVELFANTGYDACTCKYIFPTKNLSCNVLSCDSGLGYTCDANSIFIGSGGGDMEKVCSIQYQF